MRKLLLLSGLILFSAISFSQVDVISPVKMKQPKKKITKEKSAVQGACGNDTVRYAGNKAYYLEEGFNDPNTGGWGVNRQSTSSNIVTTAFKVPAGGSVSVSGVEILGIIMLTNYGAINTATTSSHKVYLYNVDANNKPTGVPIDSATINFTNNFEYQTANFIHGPHTLTTDFAVGVRGGATSNATHYLYVAYNQMHVPTDVTNPYGEHLSFKYQPAAGGFVDMATNFGNATYDFEFAINPIVNYNFAVDFTQSATSLCPEEELTLTNISTGTEIFTSHSFSLSAFAERYNVNEGTGDMDLPRDSLFWWYTGINTDVYTDQMDPISFATQLTPGTYNDTLYVVTLTHDYDYCYQRQIIPYTIKTVDNPTFSYSSSTFCTASSNASANISSQSVTGAFNATPAGLIFANTSTGEVDFTQSTVGNYTIEFVTAGSLTSCADSSTQTITITQAPSAEFNYANASYCLNAANPVPAYSNGGSAGTFSANSPNISLNTSNGTIDLANSQAGTYTVTNSIQVQGCPSASETYTVVLNSIPSVVVTPSGSLSFCEGENVTLSVPTAAGYLWNTGATSQAITVDETDLYSVVVTGSNGCTATSSNITVTVNPLPSTPTIIPNGSTTICEGEELDLTASNATTYLWSTGETTATITVTESDDYTVTVSNSYGCEATSNAITVTVVPAPAAPTITQNGILLTASAGVAYQWYLNGVALVAGVEQTYTATENGTYTVVIISGDCASDVSTSVTVSTVGVDEVSLKEFGFSVYPNPSSGNFNLTTTQPVKIIIQDVAGRIVYSDEIIANTLQQKSFDFTEEAKGTYFLSVFSEATQKVEKIVIQ